MARQARTTLAVAMLAAALDAPPVRAAEAPESSAPDEHSLQEVNKQLNNPVSELWSIAFQPSSSP